MKILAIDSSGLVASAAIIENDEMIAEYTVNYKKTHSQTLLPMIDEISKMIELNMQTIDAIAVSAGPGSFTGLRIGAATAKGLGQALNIPLIAIPTIDGLAYNLYGTDKLVCPLMDARRNQTYTGLYLFERGEDEYHLRVLLEQCAVKVEDIIKKINEENREVIFLGDGVPVFREQLMLELTVPYSFAPPAHNRQRAASIGSLARTYFQQGRVQSAEEHKPEYLRLSQAERERNEKEKGAV